MAATVKQHKQRFIDMYADIWENLQVKLLEYVKQLLQTDPASTPTAASGLPQETTPMSAVKQGLAHMEMRDGFPIMPAVIFDELKKEDYEDVLRQYLTAHYSECDHTLQ
jgi:hypothetical protein